MRLVLQRPVPRHPVLVTLDVVTVGGASLLLLLSLSAALDIVDCSFQTYGLTNAGTRDSARMAAPLSPGSGTEGGAGGENVLMTPTGGWVPQGAVSPRCFLISICAPFSQFVQRFRLDDPQLYLLMDKRPHSALDPLVKQYPVGRDRPSWS